MLICLQIFVCLFISLYNCLRISFFICFFNCLILSCFQSLGLKIDLRDYYFLDPSVFLDQAMPTHNEESKAKKADEGKQTHKEKISTEKGEGAVKSNNAFDQHDGDRSKTTPCSLTIGDESKKNALMKRLHGEMVSVSGEAGTPKVVNTENEEKDGANHEGGCSSVKRRRISKLSYVDDQGLDDFGPGTDFGFTSIEDMDIDLDINLSEIKKVDLKPDLLLKAAEDDLMIADAKSLENVLSSVIDMENEMKSSDMPSCSAGKEVDKSVSNLSTKTIDADTKGDILSIVSDFKNDEENAYVNNSSVSEIPKRKMDTSLESPKPQSKHPPAEDLNSNSKSHTVSEVSESDTSQPNKTSSLKKEQISVSDESGPKLGEISLEGKDGNIPTSNMLGIQIPDLPPASNQKNNADVVTESISSPITSSLLSSKCEPASSAAFYLNMLTETSKKTPPTLGQPQNSPSVSLGTKIPSSAHPTDPTDLKPTVTHSDNLLSRRNVSEANVEVLSRCSTNNSTPIAGSSSFSTLPSSLNHSQMSPRKSAGDFIEDVVRNELGVSACKTPAYSSPVSTTLDLPKPSVSSSESSGQKQSSIISSPIFHGTNSNLYSTPQHSSHVKTSSNTLKRPQTREPSQHSRQSRLSLLNIPQYHLNALSTLDASALASGHGVLSQQEFNLSHDQQQFQDFIGQFGTLGLSAGHSYFHRSEPVHPLVSPPIAPSSGLSSYFQRQRRNSTPSSSTLPPFSASLLHSPPPLAHSNFPPVIPPYPLLSHQHDFTALPYWASTLNSLYPPQSPSSKYPLIPSTSPSFLRSRLVDRNLLVPHLNLASNAATPHQTYSTPLASSGFVRQLNFSHPTHPSESASSVARSGSCYVPYYAEAAFTAQGMRMGDPLLAVSQRQRRRSFHSIITNMLKSSSPTKPNMATTKESSKRSPARKDLIVSSGAKSQNRSPTGNNNNDNKLKHNNNN